MATASERVERLIDRLDRTWREFGEAYAGLPADRLLEGGVTGEWSARDLIAHVAWWEEEALKHLPLVLDGGRPPRYSVTYGGIDAFNALMTARRRDWPLDEVRRHAADTHGRLLAYLRSLDPERIVDDARFRRRLRLDTSGHYPIHTADIRRWRESTAS